MHHISAVLKCPPEYTRSLKSHQESSKYRGAQIAKQHTKGLFNGFLKSPKEVEKVICYGRSRLTARQMQQRYTNPVAKFKGVKLKGDQV
eukprot:gene24286-9885_t